ncbi:MAG: hypothetical protein KDB03_06960 [Planctomycetales bacterium]|nr:hypothetical protein [Planctomycetales bacterium]
MDCRKLLVICFAVFLGSNCQLIRGQGVAGGLEVAEFSGKLAAMVGNQIKVTTEDKKDCLVNIGSDTTTQFQGTADKSFLMPGLLVRFDGKFDMQGVPQAPIEAIEIFTPIMSRRLSPQVILNQTPGIYTAEQVAAAKEGDRGGKNNTRQAPNRNTPPPTKTNTPAQPNNNANVRTNDRNASRTRNSGPEKNNQTPAASGVQDFRIVGQVGAVQDNKLQVVAGNRPLIVMLSEKAKITVSTTDTQFVGVGDAVSVSGLRDAAQPQYVEAQSITITAAKPLGASEAKDASRNSKARGTADKDKHDKETTTSDKSPREKREAKK